MPIHTVAQGEWLGKIAAEHRMPGEAVILEAPENEPLVETRPDPHTLFPGDEVFIPDPESHRRPSSARTGQLLRAVVTLKRLRVVLEDSTGAPIVAASCRVTLAGQDTVEVTTTSDGELELPVRGSPESATIETDDRTWNLHIGHLNPMRNTPDDGVSGVQGRLRNLGYAIGEVDGEIGPRTRAALRAFQREAGLPVTSQIDDATMKALLDRHRS